MYLCNELSSQAKSSQMNEFQSALGLFEPPAFPFPRLDLDLTRRTTIGHPRNEVLFRFRLDDAAPSGRYLPIVTLDTHLRVP